MNKKLKPLKIITIDNPEEEKILRSQAKDLTLEEIKSPEFKEFIDRMTDTILASDIENQKHGMRSVGLAAPQVGKSWRLFMTHDPDENRMDVFINPELQIQTEKQSIDEEACLSVPNIIGNVARFNKIRITYLDMEGNRRRETLTEFWARLIQHEYDHLQGILFIDRIKK